MIRTDEFQRGRSQIQFSMRIGEIAQARLGSDVAAALQAGSGRPGELTLSGFEASVAFISVLPTVGLLLRALIKLWLFEP